MKKVWPVAVCISFVFFTACEKDRAYKLQEHDANRMIGLMHQMMSKMDTLQKTNDPEIDFSRLMKVHHQGAIDMASLELRQGENDSLKRTAQKIISEQQVEIQQFNDVLASLSVDDNDPAFTMEQMESAIRGAETADVQLITGNTDNDFATLIIAHHQTAIDNANAYLHHGNNARLKTMAKTIIASQTREIKELAVWLKALKR